MRRLLIVFMLLVVPFQLSWGAAATYCGHESNPVVSHFGHHVHQHAGIDQASKSSSAKLQLGADNDCAVCHLAGIGFAPTPESSLSLVLTSVDAEAGPKPSRASILPSPPERPQWQRAVS